MTDDSRLPSSNQCPYCKRPVRDDGSIFHEGGCAGLEDVVMNRLQYDKLVARGSVHETGKNGEGK